MGIFSRLIGRGNEDPEHSFEQGALRLIEAGHSFEAEGRMDKAKQCYLDAIRIAPALARAHLNLGNALLGMGDLPGALQAFRSAIKHKPDYAGAYYNIGNALLGNGQLDEAVANYRRALEIKPDYAEVHCGLGVAQKNLGQLDNAITSFQMAIQLDPGLAEAHINLTRILQDLLAAGNAFLDKGEFDAAINSFQRALEIKADYAEAHFWLGLTLQDMGQLDKAAASYRRALDNKSELVEAHNNLGRVLQETGRLDEAEASYRRALAIRPDFTDAWNNLLLILNYTDRTTPLAYLEQAREYGRLVSHKAGGGFSSWRHTTQPKRLRVGLVSGDFRIHSVGHFLAGLLSHIDPTRIELIAYPTYHQEDALTARIRPYFSAWKPLFGKSDHDAAHLIHADGVHMLFDISGHTAHNRLSTFAWKPAPVQITWLGLPNTTGLSEMDYVLGDAQAIPVEHENHFSEKVWRLPDSYLCFTPPTYPIAVASLPALSNGYVTFGSFNNLTKMNDAVVELWARVLLAVPNSRLYLKTSQLHDASICEQTRQRFATYGITAERLSLSGTLGTTADHLAEYNKIDIALDTFPYPGVTTSVEALWMGVPVLTLLGDRFLSLTAKSIAHHAGLSDWVAVDKDNYMAKAVTFSSSLERLATLRTGLRRQVVASPLFDTPRFARNFENALWEMWRRYQTHVESDSTNSVTASEQDTTSIALHNGLRVTVPSSPRHMTTFVLHEQGDWFEDEINFVRHFIKPGMRAIDIGANFGLYALNIAKIIGDGGRLWAFEPTIATASCLHDSIIENRLNNIVLIQAGLSDRCGEARFYISPNSELNSLSQGVAGSDQFETIELLTLDSCDARYEWGHIDFIKIDAEGEELNIIKGGTALLASASPLIMFELMYGQDGANLPLIDQFLDMGYSSYRLIPALNILIPFNHSQPFDKSILNLFCCRNDRAAQLEQEGMLARKWEIGIERNDTASRQYFDRCTFMGALRPFCHPIKPGALDDYQVILNAYLMSFSAYMHSSEKVGCLMQALNAAVRSVNHGESSVARLVTFARIAMDAGERSIGVKILGDLIDRYQEKLDFEINELLLPAAARYDGVDPGAKVKEWLMSSIIEQYIVKHAYSAYFTGARLLPLFERLSQLGFMSEEMQKRHEFVKSAFALR